MKRWVRLFSPLRYTPKQAFPNPITMLKKFVVDPVNRVVDVAFDAVGSCVIFATKLYCIFYFGAYCIVLFIPMMTYLTNKITK